MTWNKCTIGDLCDSVSITYRGNAKKVVLINTSDVFDGKILNHDFVANEGLKGQFKKTFAENDILYSEIRPANRRFAFVDFCGTKNYIASTKLMVIRPRTDKVRPRFLYAILTAQTVIDELQHLAETRSGTFPQITFNGEVAPIPVRLPSFEAQDAIVSIIDSIDGKIDENRKINHNLLQQAQAIFQSWFVDFSHWGNTPPDWEQGVFSDYVTVKRGGSPRPIQDYLSAIGYRWLKISDVTSLQTPYITTIAEHIKESGIGKTVFLKSGSLVLSNSATPGIPKILDVDSCIHDGWLYFPQSEFSNEFLLLFFLQIRPKLVALGNGSVFTNLKTDILKSYPISKPPKEVLEEFDNIVKPIFSTILLNTRQNNHLICVRDSLLPKLMSGEIDVSQVEV